MYFRSPQIFCLFILPKKLLVVVCRFLATGDSYRTIAFNYRVGVSIVAGIDGGQYGTPWCRRSCQSTPLKTGEASPLTSSIGGTFLTALVPSMANILRSGPWQLGFPVLQLQGDLLGCAPGSGRCPVLLPSSGCGQLREDERWWCAG